MNIGLLTFFSLTVLDMSSNGITSMDWFNGEKNRELKVLLLRRNRLKAIPDGKFLYNTEIYSLDLSYNRLNSLTRRTFDNMVGLEYVNPVTFNNRVIDPCSIIVRYTKPKFLPQATGPLVQQSGPSIPNGICIPEPFGGGKTKLQ